MTRIEIDVNRLKSTEEGHAYLQARLGLPAYYGRNLDALYDCLTELPEHVLVLRGASEADPVAGRFLRVMEDAADANPGLRLEKKEDYRLIALDLDGTALRNDKSMDEVTQEAIHHAFRNGKEVAFCTGRPVAECRQILALFPEMRYLLCESGALLYDLQEKRSLARSVLPREAVSALEEVTRGRDICPVAFIEGEYLIGREQVYRLAHYRMGEFQQIVPVIATIVDDVFAYIREKRLTVDKINLFHTSAEERCVSRQRLDALGAQLYMADGEISSLECTATGVNKGTGLAMLAEASGIPTQQMIVVGDGQNDIEGMEAAGLAIAMGNASAPVKAISGAVVSDNEHWGCAEAIVKYLMGVG